MPEFEENDKRRSKTAYWAAVACMAGLGMWLIFYFFHWYTHPADTQLLYRNFPAIFGLPFSAIVSFVIVVILEQSSGPIEFEGLGFKFKGASGQVVLWGFCFLIITSTIKILWIS
jgi:hypothetical protein